MLTEKMGWLYWCLMGLIAISFGVFGSVFNTYSSLYQAKDNDMLLIPLVLSLLILVLSAILGWVVALIAVRVKHKSLLYLVDG